MNCNEQSHENQYLTDEEIAHLRDCDIVKGKPDSLLTRAINTIGHLRRENARLMGTDEQKREDNPAKQAILDTFKAAKERDQKNARIEGAKGDE